MRRIIPLGVLLLMILGFAAQGCDESGNLDIERIKRAVFREMIGLALVAIETEVGEFKADHLNWMEERIEDVFGKLLKWVPGWEDSLERAYDKVAANLHEMLKAILGDDYEGADPPINRYLKPSDFDEHYDEVMAPINGEY